MGNEYRAKVFKSGNSVALRLPKEMGFAQGDDVTVVPHRDGSFSFWRERDGLAVLMSLAGSMSAGFMAAGRGDLEQEERDWTAPSSSARAA